MKPATPFRALLARPQAAPALAREPATLICMALALALIVLAVQIAHVL